jgi:hypothetical protein
VVTAGEIFGLALLHKDEEREYVKSGIDIAIRR